MRILRKFLIMKPNRVKLMKQLKPIDHSNCLQLANWDKDRLEENDKFYGKNFFSDEAHFALCL